MIKLPLPRRRLSYTRAPYYKKPKRYGKVPLLLLAVSPVILIIGLEVVARIYVGITGKANEISGDSPIEKAYRLKFLTEMQQPIEGLSDNGNLVVTRNPSFGYKLVENQKSDFWQINEQGFREQEPLPLAKPKNEFRIFILGGSTAFGQGTQKNEETISHKLELRLQQRVAQQTRTPEKYRPDVFPFFVPTRQKLMKLPAKIHPKKYRVINAAIPGYTSGNSLAQFALQIFPYQPDMIVIIDGYADLMLPSSQAKADVPKVDEFLQDASAHYRTYLNQSFKHWLDKTYLVKTLDQLVFKPQPTLAQNSLIIPAQAKSLDQYLPADEKELSLRIKRYQENHKQLIRLAAAARIPVIIATQPEITGRPADKLLPQEAMIRNRLGNKYVEKMPQAYNKLIQANQQLAKTFPKNIASVNLYNLNQSFKEPMFSDSIHLTESANTFIAEKLYYTITSSEKIQIIPQNFYLKD
ncbi:lipolytic protein G-D-S-L family [Gloeothece citriformis PCC 7424]|uniref:Lipolytic protein G-D-S-L family n=1 Tax=Gloeothece citriformis (strain PCC 7424) TaxID=65393 RepID=B7K815_GLOC7|nr:SGNH/GDSL hydrolase family protein [Gloeothece citriformis]ACK68503.1 lipolytic protein G-D-S-L family [Gloeothece citriformis PCC 7424]